MTRKQNSPQSKPRKPIRPRRPLKRLVSFACPICRKRFDTKNALADHIRTHTTSNNANPSLRAMPALFPPPNTLTNSATLRSANSKALSTRGLSGPGEMWAMRALHPCDDAKSGGVAIPDSTVESTVNLEHRHYHMFSAPSSASGNWDLQMLVLPFPDVPLVYRTRNSGETNWSYWHRFSSSQTISGGVNRLGKVNPVGGRVLQDPRVQSGPDMQKQATQFRQTFRGLTIHHNANAISNQGYVVSGQWGAKPVLLRIPPFDLGLPIIDPVDGELGIDNPQPFYQFTDIPKEPDQVIAKLGGAGEWEAKHGVYMPLRFEDDTHLYQGGEKWSLDFKDVNGGQQIKQVGGVPILLNDTPDQTTFLNDLVFEPDSNPSTGEIKMPTSSGSINQMIGVVFFVGIDKTANVVVKLRSGLELVPDNDSPLAPVATQAPPKDSAAVEAVQQIARTVPMSWEAKYNSLGLIVPALAAAAKAVLPTVLPWIGGKIRNLFAGRPRRGYIEEPVD